MVRAWWQKNSLRHAIDEQGSFILSVFTGAARELQDALLVNPNDIEQTAEDPRSARDGARRP